MNNWENAVITNKGLALLSKLIGGTSLDITRGETGSGYVTPGLLQNQAAVTSPIQEVSFRDISYPEAGKCALKCNITNDGLKSGYTANQVGIYATDPDEGEILFFITQATSGKGVDIPSETEMPGYSSEWTFYFQYGQADNVTVTVDPSNSVSAEEFAAHANNKKNPHGVTAAQIGAADNLLSNIPSATTASRNLLYRGTLNTSNIKSADTYTSIGIYKVYIDGVSGSDFNFPTPYGIFVVNSSMDGTSYDYVSQMFYAMGNSRIFSRSSSDKGATWTEWQQAASNADLTTHTSNKKNPHGVTCEQIGAVPAAKSLAKDTDLDTVVTSGFYRINESPLNAPADVAYSQMLVVRGGNDTVAQMVFPYNQSRMFFRTGNPPSAGGTGAWKDWTQVYTSFNKPTPSEIGAAPAPIISQTDITAGSSALVTGQSYHVYE